MCGPCQTQRHFLGCGLASIGCKPAPEQGAKRRGVFIFSEEFRANLRQKRELPGQGNGTSRPVDDDANFRIAGNPINRAILTEML